MRSGAGLIFSAVRGGSGKTTISLGVIAEWRRRGRKVAVFKKGPDFIDAGWLGAAAGRPCYNLDPFLMEERSITASYAEHSSDADVAVIEGNRGLYDGVDEAGTYSTARLAAMLNTPVVIIVDCTKATGTVGAVVLGCLQYDRDVPIRGVILNNISSERHEAVIRRAIEQRCGVPVVGAIPRMRHGDFPERHMGLTPFQEHPDVERAIERARDMASRFIDMDALWEIAGTAGPVIRPAGADERPEPAAAGVRIGVLRDTAFQFYYPENLQHLERRGAALVTINALTDPRLPEIDGLYIGGGFPETQASRLADNESFCRSLREAAENGLPVYAECGGLIYLGRSLRVGGAEYPMTAVFPADFVLEKRPQAHGYTIVEVTAANPFFDEGMVLRGHEFHYSRISNLDELPPMAFSMRRGKGIDGRSDGLTHRNVLATYTHLHAGGAPEWVSGLMKRVRDHRNRTRQSAA